MGYIPPGVYIPTGMEGEFADAFQVSEEELASRTVTQEEYAARQAARPGLLGDIGNFFGTVASGFKSKSIDGFLSAVGKATSDWAKSDTFATLAPYTIAGMTGAMTLEEQRAAAGGFAETLGGPAYTDSQNSVPPIIDGSDVPDETQNIARGMWHLAFPTTRIGASRREYKYK